MKTTETRTLVDAVRGERQFLMGNPISLGGFVQKTQGKIRDAEPPEADIILIEYLCIVTGVLIKIASSHSGSYIILSFTCTERIRKLIIDISRATEYGKHNYVF